MSKTKSKSEKASGKSPEQAPVAAPATRLGDAEAQARLAVLRAQMEKQYGKGIIQNLSAQISNQRFAYQVPSGSVSLDLALAPVVRLPNGTWQTGFTPGRIIEIFGPEGGGKTTLLAHICANAQRAGKRCAYADMEHQVDPDYFRRLGVNLRALEFTQPSSGTDCMNIAKTWLQSGLFDYIFVDSVAALVTDEELKGDIGDAVMGSHGRLMSQSLRQMNSFLSTNKGVTTNIVFVNQIREKIGVMFGNPETTTGGRALKFYSSVRIDLRSVGDRLKDGENVYGQRVRAKVLKNKVAPPFRQSEFDLVFGNGIDIHADLFDLCLGRGIITGDSWFKYGDKTLGQGRRNAVDCIKTDGAMGYALYNELLTKVQEERGYHPDGSPIPGRVQEITQPMQAQIFIPRTEEEEAQAMAAEDALQHVEAGG